MVHKRNILDKGWKRVMDNPEKVRNDINRDIRRVKRSIGMN